MQMQLPREQDEWPGYETQKHGNLVLGQPTGLVQQPELTAIHR